MCSRSNIKNKLIIIWLLLISILSFSCAMILERSNSDFQYGTIETKKIDYHVNNEKNVVYLSDIDYIKEFSFAGWDEIRYDQINDGSKISLKIENGAFSFNKGIWAHADSQIAYDLSNYNYKYLTAFVGLNTTSTRGDGVKFSIATSADGKDWNTPKYEEVKLPQDNASFVRIDISDAKFVILSASKLGNNASDHAVYADAKLTNDEGMSYVVNSVDEYNEIIKSQYNGQSSLKNELELNILKKEFVQNIGQFTISSFYNESQDNKEVIDWLLNNPDALRYYILGGKPEGSYYNSLVQLSRLYRNYKGDFFNTGVTEYGTVLGDLYTRMAISLSLTHSKVVGLWMQSGLEVNRSDAVRRYAIYKYMHQNGYFKALDNLDITKWFENYTIEEMRFVMNNNIDDEEILWLNVYTQERLDKYKSSSYLTPHPYISYVYPNYGQTLYYSDDNREYFNDLFSVPDKNNEGQRIGLWDLSFTIPGGKDVPQYTIKVTRGTENNKVYKVWMNMRNKFGTGAVCGGISKTGSNIRGVHGIPSAVIGQPGHAAIIYYSQDANGNGYWNLDNDVSGWAYSEKSERMLLGWGNASFSRGYSVVYMALAQEVINDNDKFEESEKFVYLADTYKDDLVKKEQLYRTALKIQPLNIDAWHGLILLYNESSVKTEDDYYNLAVELGESLKYFPLPMVHLFNLIKSNINSIENTYRFTLLQTRLLTEATLVPNNTQDKYYVYQPSLTRLMGNHLLGTLDKTIATFSFDGDDAGKIVLANRFDGNGIRWDYSIDGKKTWKEVLFTADQTHKWQLTKEELSLLTSENDLYVHIVGVGYDDEYLYKIDIKESDGLPETLFANDLEDKFIGVVGQVQWKYNEEEQWTFFRDAEPDLTGDKKIMLRMGATGVYLTSKETVTYTFTKGEVNNKRKYIPISHLSLESVSSEAINQQGSATFALDGNYNTRWHSAWNGSDTERYITVKLDKAYNISAVEFVPAGGGNGKIYDGTVWGSIDGENWIIISQKKGLTYTNSANNVEQAIQNIKSFDADVPQRVQYVKIVADRTNGNWFTARAFNFYEDTTVKIVANYSFDGSSPGEIKLIDSEYDGEWDYSVDGGITWKTVSGSRYKLSDLEINMLTPENGIKLKLKDDPFVYSIKINESELFEIKPYINDLENRLIGNFDASKVEWKLSNESEWKSYSDKEPVVEGNNILQLRLKATGITLPSNILEFEFTENNQLNNMKYIPIEHLSIHGYSTQSVDLKRPYYASNIIDGNPNTEWHTDFRYSIANTEAYIAIKIDSPRYISGLDYLHMDASKEPYGFMKNGKVFVSEDGEKWIEVASFNDVSKDDTLKHVEFSEPVYGQFVKLTIESHDNVFASASMINLYESINQVESVVSVKYDITNKTNQNVTAELVSNDDIKVLNNNGSKTYEFKENGSFTFEYEGLNNEVKTVTAIVDWIDKDAPIGKIEYDIKDVTNQDVVATVTANEKITIINNDGLNTYTFTESGSFTFEFIDEAGNKGTATATVTWINKNSPLGTISYSKETSTNEDVIVTLHVDDGVTITNNNGSNTKIFKENGSFTFEFIDKVGNKGTATATISWIDKTPPKAEVSYNINSLTNKNVIATIENFSEDVEIVNNNGLVQYEFTENNSFIFEIRDKAGNTSKIEAKVCWIDKETPVGTITFDISSMTNKNVTSILTTNEEVTITNNDGKNTYLFESNGSFTFEFVDKAGNEGTATATVSWIDKNIPIGTVMYSEDKLTNKNVVATVEVGDEITITNNDGKNTYLFESNGSFTFEFVDKLGNKGTATATVSWIDKEAPTAKIEYSTTHKTKENVVVTIKDFNEEVIILNNQGKDTYTFTSNGTFVFKIQDKAGNVSEIEAIVDNIITEQSIVELKYSTTKLTNKDVIVTLISNNEIEILNNDGKDDYVFKENGEFVFEFINSEGCKDSITAKVNWIDKTIPTAKVIYSTNEVTDGKVTATLVNKSEEITVTNNNGKDSYVFTSNGSFTFQFIDKAGNVGFVKAKVDWIKEDNNISNNNSNNNENNNSENNNNENNNNENVPIIDDDNNIIDDDNGNSDENNNIGNEDSKNNEKNENINTDNSLSKEINYEIIIRIVLILVLTSLLIFILKKRSK